MEPRIPGQSDPDDKFLALICRVLGHEWDHMNWGMDLNCKRCGTIEYNDTHPIDYDDWSDDDI